MSDPGEPAPRTARSRAHELAMAHPLALIFFGACLYSTGPVFVGASSVSGPVFSFWRLWLGVGVLGGATVVWRLAGGRLPPLGAWRWPLLAGLSFGTHQVLFMTAIKATSVTTVALIGTMAPIVTALAAVPLFGERMGLAFRLWTVLAMAGAAIVVTGAATGPTGDPLGTLVAALNVVFFAGFFLVSKLSRDHIPVLPFLFGVMSTAAVGVTLFLLASGQTPRGMRADDYLFALAVAAGPGALGHIVMTWPLRFVAANVPPVVRLTQPVISGTLAAIFLAERIGLTHVLGGAVTLLGVGGAMLSPSGRALSGTNTKAEAVGPNLPGE